VNDGGVRGRKEVITSVEASRSRGKYLFTLDERRAADGKGRCNRARYVNHSCRPNAAGYTYGRRIWICALRAVATGEQITIDYGAEGSTMKIRDWV
jgi:SET domain-containing protein